MAVFKFLTIPQSQNTPQDRQAILSLDLVPRSEIPPAALASRTMKDADPGQLLPGELMLSCWEELGPAALSEGLARREEPPHPRTLVRASPGGCRVFPKEAAR